uniref:Glycogen synthase kinase binding protein n=1 Tax=Neogobius melanostomus TaxID=47308 RepID=A0A8C6TWZ2_9GOBI
MPCRKENYIFLEQSVTVDSKEVDALVTKIGEALQLHNNGTGHHLHGITAGSTAGGGGKQPAGAMIQKGHGCCLRLRSRSHRGSSRVSPYNIPGSGDQEWDQIRPWSKKRLATAVEDDDPHRLLQELILSGNLIKEAVRRLQFTGAECVVGDCADNVSC